MEKLKIDFEIPEYLERDIEKYIEAVNNKSHDWDCWWQEVFSSLRMAHGDYKITTEQWELLMEYYLGKKNYEKENLQNLVEK